MGGRVEGHRNERIKCWLGRFRVGLGLMLVTDALIIAGFALTIGILVLMLRATMILSHQLLEEIDERLAHAIKSLVESLPLEGIEPPNPLVQLLMSHLQSSMQNPGSQGAPRDMQGKFTDVIEIKGDD